MWLRRRREPGWMAIRATGPRIDVVHVVPGARPCVRFCESYQKEGGDAESLRRLRKALHLDRYRLTTMLDAGQYQIHQVDAPPVPPAELKAATRFRVKDLIDYPLDAATVEVIDIPADQGAGRPKSLFAVTAANECIARCVQPYHDADVPLEAIDIPELAQRNLAALFEPDARAVAMLVLYPDGGLLTITAGGELYVSRRIEIALARLVEADAEARAQYVDRIALELQRSLDNFDRQFSHLSLARLIVAPRLDNPALMETLAANLYVPVELCDLASVMDLGTAGQDATPADEANRLAVLGAALRSIEARA
jgi:MSHA biogenesis protein MshI